MLVGLLAASGLSCPALAQMLDTVPNGIVFLTQDNTIRAGTAYNVTVQILYNGAQLRSEGVRVYFTSNNTSIIPSDFSTFVLTDKGGNASYTVTPNATGFVKLTAEATGHNSGASADKTFLVTEGAIATPTATIAPSPSPSPTPTPTREANVTTPETNATITATPSTEPTPTVTPTTAPVVTDLPTVLPPSGDSNTQATAILTAGIAIAIVIVALLLVARALQKK